jgi:hypothetical protein
MGAGRQQQRPIPSRPRRASSAASTGQAGPSRTSGRPRRRRFRPGWPGARRRGRPGPGSGRSPNSIPAANGLIAPAGIALVRQLGRDQGQANAPAPWRPAAGWATARSRRRPPVSAASDRGSAGRRRGVSTGRNWWITPVRQAPGQQVGRGDGARGDQDRRVGPFEPQAFDQGQDRQALADAGPVQPDQLALGTRAVGRPGARAGGRGPPCPWRRGVSAAGARAAPASGGGEAVERQGQLEGSHHVRGASGRQGADAVSRPARWRGRS